MNGGISNKLNCACFLDIVVEPLVVYISPGDTRKRIEQEKGIIVRFVIGHR